MLTSISARDEVVRVHTANADLRAPERRHGDAPPGSGLRKGRRAAMLAVAWLIAVLTTCVLASPSSAALPGPGGVPLPTLNRAPVGDLEVVQRVPAGVRVKGWITDPDLPGQAVSAIIRIDGVTVGTKPANRSFDFVVPARDGSRVCLAGVHVTGTTSNPSGTVDVDCIDQQIRTTPIGALDLVTRGPSGVRVAGWAIDQDTSNPIEVRVYIDGAYVDARVASGGRPDVGAAYPGYGDAHGYDFDVPARNGSRVCVVAINTPSGTNPQIGCRDLAITVNPIGHLDMVSPLTPDRLRVGGWAIDPDTKDPITVHLYINGTFAKVVTASGARPDVGAAYPGYGDAHGFDVELNTPTNNLVRRELCAYAINVGSGTQNTKLGCWDFGLTLG